LYLQIILISSNRIYPQVILILTFVIYLLDILLRLNILLTCLFF